MAMASRADCCANMLLQALALLLTNGGDSSCSELQSDQLHQSPALPAFTTRYAGTAEQGSPVCLSPQDQAYCTHSWLLAQLLAQLNEFILTPQISTPSPSTAAAFQAYCSESSQ
jgi:hypothetical protein